MDDIPEWAVGPIDRLVQDIMIRDLTERYNPKYLPQAEAQLEATAAELAALIREHGGLTSHLVNDAIDAMEDL